MGPDKTWKRVVVVLSTGRQIRTPGAELVVFLRATDSEMIAIGNPLHMINRMSILKIGQRNDSDMRR